MVRILVLGAGGVGGYFGGRLVERGLDVTFLLRPSRAEHIARHGLVIKSSAGDAKLAVKTLVRADCYTSYDFILLTCKAYDLDAAVEAICPAVGEGTVIVPALNGLSHLTYLNQRFGQKRVLAGSVLIQATLSSEGEVCHLNDEAYGLFGGQEAGSCQAAKRWAALFDRALGVKIHVVSDAMQVMWDKWVRLASLAGITCLMRANIGEINSAFGGREATMALLHANQKIAQAAGYALSETRLCDIANFLLDNQSKASASMLRDMERGARTEADHILGDLLQKARDYQLENPLLALAYTHVKAYEERRRAGRL